MEERSIHFDPVAHKYSDGHGNNYISVTTLIGKYKKPFDKAYWSMYKALQANGYKVRVGNIDDRVIYINGSNYHISTLYSTPLPMKITPKDFTNNWEELTKLACDTGSVKHDFLETSVNISKNDIEGLTNDYIKPIKGFVEIHTVVDLDRTQLQEVHPKIYNRLKKYIELGWSVFAEKLIYNVDYLIAGKIDIVLINGIDFVILDWKTNKDDIRFEAGYFKKYNGQLTDEWISLNNTFLAPLDHLPESKGYAYSLQLSLYAYLMELWGYRCRRLELIHIKGIPGLTGADRFLDKDEHTKIHDIVYLKNEVQTLCNDRLKQIV